MRNVLKCFDLLTGSARGLQEEVAGLMAQLKSMLADAESAIGAKEAAECRASKAELELKDLQVVCSLMRSVIKRCVPAIKKGNDLAGVLTA